jgi:VWFA-related protein
MSCRNLESSHAATVQLVIGFAIVSLIGAQPQQSSAPVFHSRSDLVLVETVVRDRSSGKMITGLKSDDFEVFDNDELQRVQALDRTTTALEVVFVVQFARSPSRDNPVREQDLLGGLSCLASTDRAAVITVPSRVETYLPFGPAETEAVVRAIYSAAYRPGNGQKQRLIDAIVEAAGILRKRRAIGAERVVCLLTDSRERGSRTTAGAATVALLEARAALYSAQLEVESAGGWAGGIYVPLPPSGGRDVTFERRTAKRRSIDEVMSRIAQETGGEALIMSPIGHALGSLLRAARERYLLAYTPPTTKARTYRRIVIRLTAQAQSKWPNALVRARTGYYSAAERE